MKIIKSNLIHKISYIYFILQLRKAIEDANAGILPMHPESHIVESLSSLTKSETDTESNKNINAINSISSVDCEKADKI